MRGARHLDRVVGVTGVAFTAFNCIVGVGIFSLPGLVAGVLGPAAIIAYPVCAVLIALVGLCFAEAGSRVSGSGGLHAYATAAFGPIVGGVAGALSLFAFAIGSAAALARFFIDTLSGIWPALGSAGARPCRSLPAARLRPADADGGKPARARPVRPPGRGALCGVSNWAAWQIAQAMGLTERLGLAPLASVQAYYSLAGREIEHEIAPFLAASGLGLICWSPLAGGMLSGKFDRATQGDDRSRRASMPFPPVDRDRTYDLIDALREIARSHGRTVARCLGRAGRAGLAATPQDRLDRAGRREAGRAARGQSGRGRDRAVGRCRTTISTVWRQRRSSTPSTRWMSEIFDGGRREQIAALGKRSRR